MPVRDNDAVPVSDNDAVPVSDNDAVPVRDNDAVSVWLRVSLPVGVPDRESDAVHVAVRLGVPLFVGLPVIVAEGEPVGLKVLVGVSHTDMTNSFEDVTSRVLYTRKMVSRSAVARLGQ